MNGAPRQPRRGQSPPVRAAHGTRTIDIEQRHQRVARPVARSRLTRDRPFADTSAGLAEQGTADHPRIDDPRAALTSKVSNGMRLPNAPSSSSSNTA